MIQFQKEQSLCQSQEGAPDQHQPAQNQPDFVVEKNMHKQNYFSMS